MLFIREDDETLYEHRKGNSPVLLFCKALLSQSLLALVVASALQFMAFRSLTASVSISIVVLALMAFPHVPWSVWVLMQWFNLTVIFAKVVFQLPLFCEDGRLNFFGCRPLCGTEMPWTVLLGLLKTRQNANDPCSLALPSLTQLLWPDVLLSVMILLVMCAARLGGRFGSTSQILASLKILEKKNRRMSTHINREMLKAALGPELEEEDEEHGGRGSGTHLDEDETHRASRARLHLSSLTSVEFREQAYNWLKAYVVGAAHVRKPAMDLYEFRLCIALTCLGILIFGWSTMVDSGRSFSKSLQANNFSGNQVRVLVLFLMMIVVDRALYTWYRCDHIREDECGQVKDSWTWKGIMARVLQKVNVVVHIISIHVLFIRQWSRKLVQKDQLNLDVSLLSASTLSGFYVLYVTYLALSSLQLKYDVHVMRGGLRFCHSTDIGSMLVFKVYSALPFLNELRVITDWTVTETSMNLFMWLKLEDAHHGLYRTRLDMEGRAMTEPAEARPMFEKVYMGVALLFLLLVLLVGPIIFFSALNTFMLVPSMVMSATMSVDVKVEASHGHRSLNLYQAAQDYISLWSRERENLFRKTLLDHEMPFSLQDVRFPATSDEFWERSPLMQKMMADQMNPISNPDVVVKLRLAFQFQRNSSVTASGLEEVVLGNETRRVLAEMLSQPEKQRTAHSFEVPEVFENYRRIGDGADISSVDFIHDSQMAGKAPLRSPIKMMFKPADDSHPPCWLAVFNETEEPLKVTVVSNNVKSGAAGSDKETKMSINGLYLGVVLTIGNLFRSIFKDSSKRMIYEEVSDTDLLLDLCDGIYLARVQGNLRAEWELYHELLRIYRSPELLAHVSSKKGHGEKPKPDAPASSARWDRVAVHLRRAVDQAAQHLTAASRSLATRRQDEARAFGRKGTKATGKITFGMSG
ncbi:unnamed protein product [Effrenium voratum]|nr:unnamed protein product [Effrenium voratum]